MGQIGKMSISTRALLADTRGATAVEFALILPTLVILFLGIIQFGVILSVQTAMQAAAKSGARTYAVQFAALEENAEGGENSSNGGSGDPSQGNNTGNDESKENCQNNDCRAQTRARDAIEDSLSVWWDLFFTSDEDYNITMDCKQVENADKGVEAWSAEISVSLATVSLVDYLGLFDDEDRMSARATWPVSEECPEP